MIFFQTLTSVVCLIALDGNIAIDLKHYKSPAKNIKIYYLNVDRCFAVFMTSCLSVIHTVYI